MRCRHEHLAQPCNIEKTIDLLVFWFIYFRVLPASPMFFRRVGNVSGYAFIGIEVIARRRHYDTKNEITISFWQIIQLRHN